MNQTTFKKYSCEQVLDYLDSSIDLEIEESEVGIQVHVDGCPNCAAEIAARRGMRNRLRGAVRNIAVPAQLEERVREAITPKVHRIPSRPWMIALAACLVAGCGLTIAYELGQLRFSTASQNSYISSISFKVPSVIAVGLKDHVHCAFYRKFPKTPPTTEALVEKLGPADQALLPIVQQNVPADFKAMIAHHCSYQGRKYTHISMRSDSRLMSLVIAKKGPGESLSASGMASVLSESGIAMYQSGVQRFHIAAFETSQHLVYVVSDLDEQKNLQLLLSMSPALKNFLQKQES